MKLNIKKLVGGGVQNLVSNLVLVSSLWKGGKIA